MAETEQRPVVIALRGVGLEPERPGAEGLKDISIEAAAGEIVLLRRERHAEGLALFDLMEGLSEPDRGTVEFLGRNWATVSAYEQARLRGRIGRVFDDQGWISNLDLYENLVLAQRHHTRRSEEDLRSEAEALMRAAGFPAIPPGRTHGLRRHELRQAQWARAFMGSPALALLEHPEAETPRESWERLIAMVAQARERGTAIMWATDEPAVWDHAALRAARRRRLADGRLLALEESG